MQTDIINVGANGAGWNEALEEAGKFAVYNGLDKKAALRVRLLTEETLGMLENITVDYAAEFLIESDKDCAARIKLKAQTLMDFAKKKELIKASTDKKNAASKGFMGKVRQIIENCMYSIDEVGSLTSDYGGVQLMYGTMGMCETDPGTAIHTSNYLWSLENYKNSVGQASSGSPAAKEAKDELEKSIVASIADDVKIGVSGNTVELIIEKKAF